MENDSKEPLHNYEKFTAEEFKSRTIKDYELTCDVCGGKAIGVAASPLGPISNAYCKRCINEKAEPYGVLVASIASVGGLDLLATWAKAYIEPTLRITGKTYEQLQADIERSLENEREYWRRYGENDGMTQD